jgi:diguanylate cyclase (GGDEF)-like protein
VLNANQDDNNSDDVVYNILVVDESTENIQQLYGLLNASFDIHFATDEANALVMAREIKPDLAILAVACQSFDTMSMCLQFRMPVILVAKTLVVDEMVQGIEAGAVDYLTLPLNAQDFHLRVAAHIGVEDDRSAELGNQDSSALIPYPERKEKSVVQAKDGDREKILIVDDSISNIQVLNEILGDEHEVFFATNGKDAIDMALEDKPDLIILDVVMPQMDGYAVCHKLKEMQETKDIGIIFVTALNEVQDEAKGLQLGALDYIIKPFSAHIVRARMHNHLELIKNRKMLNSLSMTDGLTGIANRRQFDQLIHRELHRAIRQRESITLMLIDIDNFKKYNDHYGHVNGDKCLKEVAVAMATCRVRMTDFVARYGGEEFAVVLPNTDGVGAEIMANKLMAAIRNLAITHENNCDFGIVTASFGVFSIVPEAQTTIEQIIKQADENLYSAKSAGRNRAIYT